MDLLVYGLGGICVTSIGANAFFLLQKRRRKLGRLNGEGEQAVKVGEEEGVVSDGESAKVDFQAAPARATRNPTSPLVIAIDDLAARSLNEAAYTEINKQLGLFARALLAKAKVVSTRKHDGNPFSTINAPHVRSAVGLAVRDLALESDRRESLSGKVRELTLAIFAAAVGMAVDLGLGLKGASHSVEAALIIFMLIISSFLFLFLRS